MTIDEVCDLRCGDCLSVMPALHNGSVDAIVTDPPYGLSFMGAAWDHQVPGTPFWAEALRVAKPGAHLLAFGGTRTFHRLTCAIEDAGWEIRDVIMWVYGQGWPKSKALLKPAWEPIIMSRKHGPGVLNIEACRVPVDGCRPDVEPLRSNQGKNTYDSRPSGGRVVGRWPANIIHDGSDDVVSCFPETESGKQAPGGHVRHADKHRTTYATFAGQRCEGDVLIGDSGNASRLFYCAKASPSDREDGNTHATVKPQALMRYLCRLVTPPGGLVLDPFMGSGTTGKAALSEGFRFLGIELERDHFDIAERRLRKVQLGIDLREPAC